MDGIVLPLYKIPTGGEGGGSGGENGAPNFRQWLTK